MRVIVALLLVASGLAGCSGSDAGDDRVDATGEEPLRASSTTGILHGVVVDATVTPIEGAKVALAGRELVATTGPDGAFGFSDLDPGTYFVTVSKAGYSRIQTATKVEAAQEPPAMRVQIERLPDLDPYSDTRHFEGFIQCSIAFSVNAVALCSVPEVAGVEVGDDYAVRYTDMATIPDFVQSELVWRSTQNLGQTLKLRYTDDHLGEQDNYRTAEGGSPLRVRADNETLVRNHLPSQGLWVRVFPSYSEPPGVVVVLQQSFDIYTSAFWKYTPPDDWWFIDAGERPPPPQ